MEFLSGLFTTVAAFFGFSEPMPEPMPAPAPMVEEQVAPMAAASGTEASSTSMMEDGDAAGEVAAAAPEGSPATATDAASEVAMTGTAPATTDATATPAPDEAVTPDVRTMLVAGGCFWCVEADLEKLPGVIEVVSGYGGGTTDNPTYADYGAGGHREVAEVTYNANQVSFEDILIVTMKTTDPTDDDGTFADRGDKYSAAFYYETPEQQATIEQLIAEVNEHGPYDAPLAIDVESRPTFWRAEDRHQDYYKGTFTQLKYKYYRNASGRDEFIAEHWGDNTGPTLPWRVEQETQEASMNDNNQTKVMWKDYQKPSNEVLRAQLDALTYEVTQEDGTEPAGTSPLDKNYEPGIYVDVLSGEPLFSSRDKYDSGTGWPSFVRPITPDAVTEHEDRKLFTTRTEIRSAVADNHIGHVFDDGPEDRTGLRYCMNGVALEFVPKEEMAARGYGAYLSEL